MCIAIYKPFEHTLSRETLKECWDNNPDGAGFIYNENGNLVVVKGLMKFKVFMRAYDKAQKVCGNVSDFVIHFRIASAGKVNKNNTHPHSINDNLAFVHNGTISAECAKRGGKFSDTVLFNNRVLQNLPEEFYKNEVTMNILIGDYIGYSKLIFMDSAGYVAIVNESFGIWDNGIWLSNDSYLPRVHFKINQYAMMSYWNGNFDKHYDVAPTISDDTEDDDIWLRDDFNKAYYCAECNGEFCHHELEDGYCEVCWNSKIEEITSRI